jgi:hypothetical protein
MADPLSTGASVVTFLALAWSSAKSIHDFLTAVKDGPENTKHLADTVKQLQGILERLQQLQTVPMDSADLAELTSLSTRCAQDLGNFNDKLRRLDIPVGDRRIGRIWKRLKVAISQSDLDRMRSSIEGHISILSFRMTLLITTRVSLQATQSTEMLEILRDIKTGLTNSLATTNPLAAATSLASANSQTVPVAVSSEQVIYNETQAKLEESICRLIELINEKDSTVECDDAEQLMSDLQTILDCAHQKDPTPTSSEQEVGVQESDNISKELRLVSSLMFSAPSISINSSIGTATSPLLFGIMNAVVR